MIDVGNNFGQTKPCPTWQIYVSLDSQEHLFRCEVLNNSKDNIEYDDVYSNSMRKVSHYADKIDRILRKREVILKKQNVM